jgi:hypothetical protein
MTAPAAPGTAFTDPPAARELRIEQLVSRRVRDPDGRKLGRVEEIIAEIQGIEWVVVEVHVGSGALLERLVALSALVPIIGKLTRRSRKRYCIPWAQLDVSDPDHPRALVRQADLGTESGE